jgi:hypothetical protein
MFFGQRMRSHLYLIPGGAGLPVAVVVPVDAVDPGGVVRVHRVVGILVRLLKHETNQLSVISGLVGASEGQVKYGNT